MHRFTTALLLVLSITLGGIATADDKAKPAPVAPAKQPLTKNEARREAARLANAAIDARTDLKYPNGDKVKGNLKPEQLTGGFANGRWAFSHTPPAGTSATVSFDKLGGNVKVVVGHADE